MIDSHHSWPDVPSRSSRRSFLRVAGATAFAAAGGVLSLEARGPALAGSRVPGKERMLLRSFRYLDLEMPMARLDSWITPVDLFFVRNHFAWPPSLELSEWRLRITGEVDRPLTLAYDEVLKLEAASLVNTMECAGNGRAFFEPKVPGVQWERGAVGTARFGGPRLSDLLRRAGIRSTARHVLFHGLDEPPGKAPHFERSIPVQKAMHPDTLLATSMNGRPLHKYHGFPLRSVVPGWVGAASVKWLSEIRVLSHEFDGFFMTKGYRFPNRPVAPHEDLRPEETRPLGALSVKSLITGPADGAMLKPGLHRVTGAAWAGEADVRQVEVSTDGGQTWQVAQLAPQQAKYAWRLWSFDWKPRPGSYALVSRASDSFGRQQPLAPFWNPSGYLWNVADRVRIQVRGPGR